MFLIGRTTIPSFNILYLAKQKFDNSAFNHVFSLHYNFSSWVYYFNIAIRDLNLS